MLDAKTITGLRLSVKGKSDLIAFLKMLTDNVLANTQDLVTQIKGALLMVAPVAITMMPEWLEKYQ